MIKKTLTSILENMIQKHRLLSLIMFIPLFYIIMLVIIVLCVNAFACSQCQEAISKGNEPPKYHRLEEGEKCSKDCPKRCAPGIWHRYDKDGSTNVTANSVIKSPTETFTITPVNNDSENIEIKKD